MQRAYFLSGFHAVYSGCLVIAVIVVVIMEKGNVGTYTFFLTPLSLSNGHHQRGPGHWSQVHAVAVCEKQNSVCDRRPY